MLQGIGPLLGVLVLALGAASGLVLGVPRAQPGAVGDFDHAGHIERGLDCVDCHDGVESRLSAGVPSVHLCLEECHAEDVEKEAMESTANGRFVLSYFERGEELWWPQRYALPAHVQFSHQRHVVAGKVPCATCHGAIADAQRLPIEPVEATLTMSGCLACHRRRGVSTDCFNCHK